MVCDIGSAIWLEAVFDESGWWASCGQIVIAENGLGWDCGVVACEQRVESGFF